jgi:hypothetical protein
MIRPGPCFTADDMPEEMLRPRLKIDRNNGLPITVRGVKRGVLLNKTAIVHPKLEGRVSFYSVTETELGPLVAMSDGECTRYYWFGNNRRDTYMVPYGCEDNDCALNLLFLYLAVDERAIASTIYKHLAFIFMENMLIGPHIDRCIAVALPNAEGVKLVDHFERSMEIGEKGVRVWLAHSRSVRYIDLPMADHPLAAIVKARNVAPK